MSASIFWDVCTKKAVEVDGESTDFFIFEPREEELSEIN